MSPAPIRNAKDVLLSGNPGTLPDVGDTLTDYFQPITFTAVTKTLVNFSVVESGADATFQGVRQPLTPQRLLLKPEGERSWKWEMIHAEPGLQLEVDDQMKMDGVTYRVMAKQDFSRYGYIYYEVVNDWT